MTNDLELKQGSVAILNVGAGDIRLSFDNTNPAELIRAARVVKDMLRRGYALLVEVDEGGEKRYRRALDFDESACAYIIADLDPKAGETPEEQLNADRIKSRPQASEREEPATKKQRGRSRKSVPASGARAVAVAPTSGG
jgi:hypothetical protein